MSPQWLLYDGQPVAESLILSHTEQLDRMRAAVPEAVGTAVVAGDPCYDRIRASIPFRSHYRALFGVDTQRRVVVVSSTWGARSLLGTHPTLLRRLLAESTVDDTAVIAVVHPNVWHGHGPWQLRTWLADCVRAGLIVVPPLEGWRAALIAADCVIGDHGAVTCYGAALGRPVLLGAFPEEDVAAGSPVALLGSLAPRLSFRQPLIDQVEAAVAKHRPESFAPVEELVSSHRDESAHLLRRELYRLLRLDEPSTEPVLARIPDDGTSPAPTASATLVAADVDLSSRTVRLLRHPTGLHATSPVDRTTFPTHLAVGSQHPGRLLLSHADVVHARETDLVTTTAEILATHPGCALAAVTTQGRATIRTRSGAQLTMTTTSDVDPAALASAAFAWLDAGHALTGGLHVVLGGRRIDVATHTR